MDEHKTNIKPEEKLNDEIKFLQIRITELEKSNASTKKNDDLLHKIDLQQKAILNNIPDIAWLKDKASRFIAVNEAFAKACGYKQEELVGKSDLDIWPADLAVKYREDDAEVILSKARKIVEERLVDKEGKVQWIETIKTPIFNEDGEVIGTTGISRDITERKRYEERLRDASAELEIRVKVRTAELAKTNEDLVKEVNERKLMEKALRESEEKFRTVADFTIDWEYWQGPDNKMIYISPSCKAMTGYSQEEFIKDKFLIDKIVHPEDAGWLNKEINAAVNNCKILAVDFRIITAKKETRWISHVCTPIFNKNGDFLGRRASNRDITDKKKNEEELLKYKDNLEKLVRERTKVLELEIESRDKAEKNSRALQKQIEFILGVTKTGLDIIDQDYNIRYIDAEWAKKYGDPTGKKCYEYFMGKREPCPVCGVREALETKKVVVTEESLLKEENRLIQVTTIPFQNELGEWLVAEVNVDINERKKIEEDLKKYRDHLEDLVKERSRELIEEIEQRKLAEFEKEKLNRELMTSNERLRKAALIDPHTGLFNHRYLTEVIEAEFHRARRYAHPLAVIMVDIDYFKSVNELYGHRFGDMVLKQFARLIKIMVRRYDIAIRSGGEEFIVISPGVDMDQALAMGKRVLETVGTYNFGDKQHKIKLKASLSVVSYPEDKVLNGIRLVNLAERILNKVKDLGGNRVYSNLDLGKENKKNGRGKKGINSVKFLQGKINKLTKSSNQSLTEAIFAFAKTIELKDRYTGEHAENTVRYVTDICNGLKLPKEEVEIIKQGAVLHDLGKIGISEKILLKKSKLTKQEIQEIRRHPQIGADILRPIQFLRNIVPLVFYHHEKWDGTGYPSGLKGEEIPIGSRIIAIADVYQALTSDRPYRKAYSQEKAISLIKQGSGTHFDPKIVDLFLKSLQKLPKKPRK